MLLFAWIVIDQIAKAEKTARDDALTNDTRLLHIMSQQIELTFIGVDNALHRAEEKEQYTKLSRHAKDPILQTMHQLVLDSPRLTALIMVDPVGKPLLAVHKQRYRQWLNYSRYSFLESDVFMKLRSGDDSRYYIGKLPPAIKGAPAFIIMGHRISNADGSFGGAFIAIIDPEIFVRYFKTVEQGSRSYISLQAINSGTLLAGGPVADSYYEDLNKLALAAYKSDPSEKRQAVNTYDINYNAEIYGFTKIKSLPILLTIVLDDTDYLKSWR